LKPRLLGLIYLFGLLFKAVTLPYLLLIRRVLTTANTVGTNGLTCLRKHDRVGDNKFSVTRPMTGLELRTLLSYRNRTLSELDDRSTTTQLLFVTRDGGKHFAMGHGFKLLLKMAQARTKT
jgi:hypothetical protein